MLLYNIHYTAKTELLFQAFLMVTSVASFIEKISIFLYSSTRHECLCGISTKELLQCVLLIISNCLWNELCVAITTVTNGTLKELVILLTRVIFPSYLGMHAVNHITHICILGFIDHIRLDHI